MIGRINDSEWYLVTRLRAEGPYEPIRLHEGSQTYIPEEGPLANTETDTPNLWCILDGSALNIAPIMGDGSVPTPLSSRLQIRGYYNLDTESNKMVWHPIGDYWDENEIPEYKALSNLSYQLYKKVPVNPEHVFLFGAGASYGSDAKDLRDYLPPLGNKLYFKLKVALGLKYWKTLPLDVERLFLDQDNHTFEEAMEALNNIEDQRQFDLSRDRELAIFFSRYKLTPNSLYSKLAGKISQQLKTNNWSGAAVTLNYERLLEEAFKFSNVFSVVKGITHYDIEDDLVNLNDNQLIEICYPHGGCQFVLPQDIFQGFETGLIFSGDANIGGNVGVYHLRNPKNILTSFEPARKRHYFPQICRYQPDKHPSLITYFLNDQKERSKELLLNAKIVTIVAFNAYNKTMNISGDLYHKLKLLSFM
ncbi:MAG TPA: hypothetical protein VF556_04770 [Pyrinomonadaceae bacterium]|jgi:hypothetical protein